MLFITIVCIINILRIEIGKSSYLEFLHFIDNCNYYKNKDILLISGSNKRKNFEVTGVMKDLINQKNLNINIGVAYNPYLKYYYNICDERVRFEEKISTGLTKSVWLQFGTDIKLLESEINFLKQSINIHKYVNTNTNIKFYGSILIPSIQFISRFKFRPWKGVYISEKYLNSLDKFNIFTKDLIDFYLENNICPVIETEFTSLRKIDDIYNLLKD